MPTQPLPKPRPQGRPPDPDDRARRFLMFTLAALVVVLALVSVFFPDANMVLDRIVPLLTMVVGYFFGQETRRHRS